MPDPDPPRSRVPRRLRRTELDAPASPAQRLLTIVVAPFVIGWLAITSIGRAIKSGVLLLLDGLDGLALSIWRRSRLLLAIVGKALRQVGYAFRQVGAIVERGLAAAVGAIRHGLVAISRAVRHGLGTVWGAAWGTIRPILARLGALVRAAWAAIKRAGWAFVHVAAPILRRAGLLVRGALYWIRDGLRAAAHTVTLLLRRFGVVLRGIARPIASAIRVAFRAILELLRRWAVILKGGLLAAAHALRAVGRSIKALVVRLWVVARLAWRSTLGIAFRWALGQRRRLWARLLLALRIAWLSVRWIGLRALRAFGEALLAVGRTVTWFMRRGFLAISSAWHVVARGIDLLVVRLASGLQRLLVPIVAAFRSAIHAALYRIAAPLLRATGRAIRDTVDRVLPGLGRLVRAVWAAVRTARTSIGQIARAVWTAVRSARTTIMSAVRNARASLGESMRNVRAGVRHTIERQRASWRALRARFNR